MASVPLNRLSGRLTRQASTASRVTIPQVPTGDGDLRAAGAATTPVLSVDVFQRRQASVDLSAQIDPRPLLLEGTPIVRLLDARCPSAVARRVRPIIVRVAIQRVLCRRPRTHIGQEPRKVLAPLLSHRNAATAVAVVRRVVRVEAAPLRTVPRDVLRCQPSRRGSVRRTPDAQGSLPGTPTVRRASGLDAPLQHLQFVRPAVPAGTRDLDPAERQETHDRVESECLRHAQEPKSCAAAGSNDF